MHVFEDRYLLLDVLRLTLSPVKVDNYSRKTVTLPHPLKKFNQNQSKGHSSNIPNGSSPKCQIDFAAIIHGVRDTQCPQLNTPSKHLIQWNKGMKPPLGDCGVNNITILGVRLQPQFFSHTISALRVWLISVI